MGKKRGLDEKSGRVETDFEEEWEKKVRDYQSDGQAKAETP